MDRLRSTRSRDHPSSIFLRHRTHHLLFGVFHLRGDLAHGPPRPAQTSSFLRQRPLQNLDETFDVPDFPEISQPPGPPALSSCGTDQQDSPVGVFTCRLMRYIGAPQSLPNQFTSPASSPGPASNPYATTELQ